VVSPGTEGANALRGALTAAKRQSRAWQAEQVCRTGFASGHAELGHGVIATLRQNGYHPTVAQIAGHLAAVGTAYNWQGNARVAELVGRSERTIQRARARLEGDGLLTSHILLPGDMIDGQRSPVRRPQVVRDVSRLQRLANVHAARLASARSKQRPGRRRPSAAEVSPPVPTTPMTAADWQRLGEAHPEFAAFHATMAKAAARGAEHQPPPNAAHVTVEEIDDADRLTAELERELRQRERAPPTERGPPKG
jgi:hypothetical protein